MNVKYIKRDAEMDRIADAFSGYIHRHSNLDLVWSEKIGYVLMTINPDKRLGEEYCSFHTAHNLAYRLFSEIVTDVVLETESWNDSSNLDEMETKEVRLRWTPFLEMLPEYASVCEDILTGNKDKYSEWGSVLWQTIMAILVTAACSCCCGRGAGIVGDVTLRDSKHCQHYRKALLTRTVCLRCR